MVRFANVATPATAVTVVVPNRLSPVGPDPIDSVTAAPKQAAIAPAASCASTRTGGSVAPAVVLPGGEANTRAVTVQAPTEVSFLHPASQTARAVHAPIRIVRPHSLRAAAARNVRIVFSFCSAAGCGPRG